MSIEMRWSTYDETPVLVLSGRVIEQGCGELQSALTERARQAQRIVVDVTDVDFLDSHALGQIMYHRSEMKKRGAELVLFNRSGAESSYMARLIETTGLGQVISVVSSYEQL